MVRIYEKTGQPPANTAYCLVTQYIIKGGFIPEKMYVFETEECDLEKLKRVVDDYFATVVKTDLYVKEIPKDSTLFEQEAERLYGTVNVLCGSRAE
ncbi:hypothetical protein [Mucilaginibacter sp. HD30]